MLLSIRAYLAGNATGKKTRSMNLDRPTIARAPRLDSTGMLFRKGEGGDERESIRKCPSIYAARFETKPSTFADGFRFQVSKRSFKNAFDEVSWYCCTFVLWRVSESLVECSSQFESEDLWKVWKSARQISVASCA